MITTAALVATIRRLTPVQLIDAAPGLRADTVHDLRDQFADWAARQRPAEEVDTWQEAWNRWARVDQSCRLGTVQVTPVVALSAADVVSAAPCARA